MSFFLGNNNENLKLFVVMIVLLYHVKCCKITTKMRRRSNKNHLANRSEWTIDPEI